MVPLDFQLVKEFLHDQYHFVSTLCKPIFNLSKTKNDGKHPIKYFSNKYKFSLLVTLKQFLDNNLPLEDFCQQLLCVKDYLLDGHKNCTESCKQKHDKNYGKPGRYLNKNKTKKCMN